MRKETRERAGQKGVDMNIWGLLETEDVPSCSPDLHCQRENHGNDFAAFQMWSWIHMPYNDSFASYCLNISVTLTRLLYPILKHFFFPLYIVMFSGMCLKVEHNILKVALYS